MSRFAVCLAAGAMVLLSACGSDEKESATTSAPTSASPASALPSSAPQSSAPESTGSAASSSPAAAPTGPAPSKVTIGAGGTQAFLAYASHLVARGQNLFAPVGQRFNTTFEFIDAGAGGDMIALVAGGTADGLLVGTGPHAAAIAGGVPITAVVPLLQNGALVLVGAKKYEQERGKDLSKYADATWGYTGPGSNSEIISQYAAKRAGLTWTDLKTIAFGQISAGMEGVRANRLDIVAVDTSTAGKMIEEGIGYLASNDQPEMYGAYLTLPTSFVEKYPELTQAIVDVYLEGRKMVKEVGDDAPALLALFPEEYRKALQPGLSAAWPITRPLLTGSSVFTPERMDVTVKFLLDNSLLKPDQEQAFRDSFTNKFVEASSIDH